MYWVSITYQKENKEQVKSGKFYGSLINIMASVEEIQKKQ